MIVFDFTFIAVVAVILGTTVAVIIIWLWLWQYPITMHSSNVQAKQVRLWHVQRIRLCLFSAKHRVEQVI